MKKRSDVKMKIKKMLLIYLMFVVFSCQAFALSFIEHNVTNSVNNPTVMEVVDFDLDGDYDVISENSDYVDFLNNTGSMSFNSPIHVSQSSVALEDLRVVDLNQDGDLDVITSSQAYILSIHNVFNSYGYYVYPFPIQNYVAYPPPYCTSRALDYGNIDNDVSGDIDIIYSCANPPDDDAIYWSENNKNTVGWSDSSPDWINHTVVPNSKSNDRQYYTGQLVDINLDGYLDYVSGSQGVSVLSKALAWYENNISLGGKNSTWHIHDVDVGINFYHVKVVDIDKDGDMDIIAGTATNITWYVNDGSENFVPYIMMNVDLGLGFDVNDIDNDGDLDLVSSSSNYLYWTDNINNTFSTSRKYTLYYGPSSTFDDVSIIDFDKDGDLDIVVSDRSRDTIMWFENTISINITGYTCTSMPVIDETFDYFNNFTLHGWEYYGCTTPLCNDKHYPISSPFGTNGFGYDDTSTSSSGFNRVLGKSVFTNFSDNKLIISYDSKIGTHGLNNPLASLVYNSGNYSEYFYLSHDISGLVTTQFSTLLGHQSCVFTKPGESYNTVIEIDMDNKRYNVYINNTNYCYNKTLTTDDSFYIQYFALHSYIDNMTAVESYADNIVVCEGTTTESLTSCSDSDGINYLVKGSAIYDIFYEDYCLKDYGFPGESLVEFYCSGGSLNAIIKNCTDYGGTYSCNDGRCVGNTLPVINNVLSYRNCTGCPFYPYRHDLWYTPKHHIFWYVNATDYEGNYIYTAVDCDITTAPYMSSWSPANTNDTSHYNCTYSSTGNYTARIYVNDGSLFGDYSSYIDDNVIIRECINYQDCDIGYQCDTGTGLCYIPSNVTNCTETDLGVEYTVKGTTTTLWGNYTDYCYNALTVYEYWCNPGPEGYSSTKYNCRSIDSSYVCYNGRCQNSTPTAYTSLYVRDFDTSQGIEGIKYEFVQYPSYTVVEEGYTPSNGLVTLSLPLGYEYQLVLDDDGAFTYKDWLESRFVLTGTINAYLEKHCSPDCVFTEDFSYADSIYHHGWHGANYTTDYISDYGFVLNIDTNKSTDDIDVSFPEPTKNVQEIKYTVIMSEDTPAYNQELYVYLQSISDDNIFLMRYDVDNTDILHVYYFLSGWHEITLSVQPQPDEPLTTILYYNSDDGKMDIYFDSLSTGNEVLYVQNSNVITHDTLQKIRFDPQPSTYGKSTYVDSISISQDNVKPGEEEEGSVTNPTYSDLETPWYRDSQGELHFDPNVCEGWKSYIMCAMFKQGVKYTAKGTSWVFSGVHILYFIVILFLLIIIGPLLVEFFKSRK